MEFEDRRVSLTSFNQRFSIFRWSCFVQIDERL